MKNFLFLITCLSVCILSCKKASSPPCSPNTVKEESLKGFWLDSESNVHDLHIVVYEFQFFTDSFRMKRHEVSDLILVDCDYLNSWFNYSKGSYSIENDSLFLSGFYCDDHFIDSLEVSSCPYEIHTGEFEAAFKARTSCDTLILEQYEYPQTIKLYQE